MKDVVLLELARRWESDAETPMCENGHESAQRENAIAEGIRRGKRECADHLRMLVQLMGGDRIEKGLKFSTVEDVRAGKETFVYQGCKG